MKTFKLTVDRKSLTDAIDRINNGEPGPILDLEWLLTRFDDTVKYGGQLKEQSIEHLEKDLKEFREEFPGVLLEVDFTMYDE